MTIWAIIGGAVVAAVGYWISRYAESQVRELPERNPELAQKVAESQDWAAFDAIITPRKQEISDS